MPDEINTPLFGMMKRIGNQAAVECIARTGLPPADVRGGPIELIKSAFKTAQVAGSIPKWAKLKAFRTGWRGTINLANHGKVGTYVSGCRCDECKEVWRVYNKQKRDEKKIEFQRLQQELAAKYSDGSLAAMEREHEAVRTEYSTGTQGAD